MKKKSVRVLVREFGSGRILGERTAEILESQGVSGVYISHRVRLRWGGRRITRWTDHVRPGEPLVVAVND